MRILNIYILFEVIKILISIGPIQNGVCFRIIQNGDIFRIFTNNYNFHNIYQFFTVNLCQFTKNCLKIGVVPSL